jgi:hypothetical protein
MSILSDRILRTLAWFLVGMYLLLAGIGFFFLLLTIPSTSPFGVPLFGWILLLIVWGIWPVIGGLIINRHPRHPVGWLLFASFPVAALDLLVIGYTTYATSVVPGSLPIPGAVLVWLNWSAQSFVLVTLTLMYLLFPTGRLISRRWRIVAWIAVIALPVYLALQTLQPGPLGSFPELENPFGAAKSLWAALEPIYIGSFAILLLCNLAAVISLFLRLQRSRGDERQQVKWLVLPAIIFWISQPLTFVAEFFSNNLILVGAIILTFASIPFIVVAVAVAIFHYRLYDIDLIIRRTVVYGALTATLAFVYLASIVLLQGLFVVVTGEQSAAAIVISTLLITALFNPLRKRIQNDIDRRFYRRKYDADQMLEAFAEQLRHEVNLEQISRNLLKVAAESMQPERIELWLAKTQDKQ